MGSGTGAGVNEFGPVGLISFSVDDTGGGGIGGGVAVVVVVVVVVVVGAGSLLVPHAAVTAPIATTARTPARAGRRRFNGVELIEHFLSRDWRDQCCWAATLSRTGLRSGQYVSRAAPRNCHC